MKIDGIPFEVKVPLGNLSLSSECFKNLEVGDVLLLEKPLNEPSPLLVAGEPKFKGTFVTKNNKKALKLNG